MANEEFDNSRHDQQLVDVLLARHERLIHDVPPDGDTAAGAHVDADERLLSEAAEFDDCLRLLEQERRHAQVREECSAADGSTIRTTVERTRVAGLPRENFSALPPHNADSEPGAGEIAESLTTNGGRFGRFEIEGELGRGGLGVVLLAYDPLLARHVALKIPRPEALLTPNLRQRFRREAQAAARLTHPHIVPIYEVGEDGPICFIAAARIEGESLAEWLKRQTSPVDPRWAATIVADLADAMHYAHGQGVLHRDLKPGNVLLEKFTAAQDGAPPDDRLLTPKITDFGLAKILDQASDETRTGAIIGTPAYMAPEQAKADLATIAPATDIYALGAILYELLTGQPPFRSDSDAETLRRLVADEPIAPRVIRPAIHADLEAICLRCLEKESSLRYATAAELAEDLQRFLAGKPTVARPLSRVRRGLRWARREPVVAGLVTTAALLLATMAVGGVTVAVRLDRSRREAESNFARAEASAGESAQLLYGSRIRNASEALRHSDYSEARNQLAKARGKDAKLCGFEWDYLSYAAADTRAISAPSSDAKAQRMFELCFSPNGQWLIGGRETGKIYVWDTQSGALVRELEAHSSCANAVTFTPDGTLMASASCDKTVKLWDTSTWEPIGEPLHHPNKVKCCCFSSDGRLLATGTDDVDTWQDHPADFCVWDVASRTLLAHLPAERSGLMYMVYSEPLRQFLAVDGRGSIERCDVSIEIPKLMKPLEAVNAHPGEHNLWRIAISPDGLTAATRTPAGIEIWNLMSLQVEHQTTNFPLNVGAISFLPDGQRMLLGPLLWNAGDVVVWNSALKLVERAWHGYGSQCLAISPDGGQIAAGNAHGPVALHRLGPPSAWPRQCLSLPDWNANRVEYCDNQNLLWGDDRENHCGTFWNASTGERVGDEPVFDRDVGDAVASRNGGRLYVCDPDNRCGWLLDPRDRGRMLRTAITRGHALPAFSFDGRLVAGFDDDSALHVVDAESGQTLQIFQNLALPASGSTSLCFRRDATGLAIARDASCLLLDLRTGESRDFGPGAKFVCFAPNDCLVLKLGAAGQCGLCDAGTGERLRSLEGCDGPTQVGDFAPDGKTVAVATPTRLDLFQVATGTHLIELTPETGGYLSSVLKCHFSADGRQLVAIAFGGPGKTLVQFFRTSAALPDKPPASSR